jgi:nucleotide-binding universal stress UspA family protein
VPEARLREEAQLAPADLQWLVSPREEADATLRAAVDVAVGAGVESAAYARQGDSADAIVDVAEEQGAELIVVGHKGMAGARRFLLARCPTGSATTRRAVC